MSWSEVLKINSDVTTPLNELFYALNNQGPYYFTETSSFVVPTNCTLTIRACGGGGNGHYYNYCRGGGGGGGYCKDRRSYKKGDVISISISSGNTVVRCATRGLSMTASSGSTSSNSSGKGIGGSASGGNLLNLKGGNGAWVISNTNTSNQYYHGGNATATSGGCGGGGSYDYYRTYSHGANGVFAGGHGGSAMTNSNQSHGGDGGSGNFCGGSGGWGSNGYTSTNGGNGGNGGNSAWGIGGCGGGCGSSKNNHCPGNGGSGYLRGGNTGTPGAVTATVSNITFTIPQKAGDSIVGPGGKPNGEGPGMSGRAFPRNPGNRGYGCGGGNPTNDSTITSNYLGGLPICIIEVGLGEGDY